MKFLFPLLAILSCASAFMVPVAQPLQRAPVRARDVRMAVETQTYWEGKAPSSAVLGPFLSKVPSKVLGPVSLVALVIGASAVHQSNIFNTVTLDTIEPGYFLASFLCPISWGLHVAAWIQAQNEK